MMADEFGFYSAPRKPFDWLVSLIRSDSSVDTFVQALKDAQKDGVDLDAEDGKLLRLCAEKGNYMLAKQLYLHGTDVFLATESLNAAYLAISKTTSVGSRIPKSRDVQEEHSHLQQSLQRINKWRKAFLEDVSAQVTMQRLHDLERKIDTLQATVTELTEKGKTPLFIAKPLVGPSP